MIISVKDIPEDGLSVHYSIPPGLVLGREYWKLASELDVEGKLYRSLMRIKLEGVSRKKILCARCMGELILPYSISFEREFGFDSLEDKINLNEIVFQEIDLRIPIRELCSTECKGLCPVCGVNLNSEICNCEKEV